MDKNNIKKQLHKSHIQFINYINTLNEEDYVFSYNNKWNASQHTEHILKSINRLGKALKIPKFLLKSKFGTANRESKSYDELVKRYLERIKNAKATPKGFQPKTSSFENREIVCKKLEEKLNLLIRKLDKISEEKLDYYILPHPLLGKQTLREHFYFAIYHVGLHQKFVQRDLANNKK